MDLQDELQRTNLELESFKEKIKENQEKIKLNKQLPYLVGNIVEVIHSMILFCFLYNLNTDHSGSCIFCLCAYQN